MRFRLITWISHEFRKLRNFCQGDRDVARFIRRVCGFDELSANACGEPQKRVATQGRACGRARQPGGTEKQRQKRCATALRDRGD